MRNGLKVGLGLFLILSLLVMSPVYAFADEVFTQFGGNPILVSAGHSAETVVAVNTDARIAGVVTDVVFAINGNVYLEPTAQVDLIIDLGGHVYNSAQRPVRTGVFEVNFTQTLINQLLLGTAILFGVWFARVVSSLVAIVIFTALGYFMKNRLAEMKGLLSSSALRLFGVGTGSALVAVCLAVLLSLTVIGIPAAVFLLIVCLVATSLGLVPVIDYLGSKLLSQRVQEYPSLTKWLSQSLLFAALVNLPLLGFVFVLAAGVTGFGLMLTFGWMYVKGRKKPSQI